MKDMNVTVHTDEIRQKSVLVELRNTDLDLLRVVGRYTVLQTSDLQKILHRNVTSMLARCRQLVAAGFLDRMVLPWERFAPGARHDEYCWMLGPRGVSELRRLGLLPSDYRYTKRTSNLTLDHDLGIARFHDAIQIFTIEPYGWEQRRSKV